MPPITWLGFALMLGTNRKPRTVPDRGGECRNAHYHEEPWIDDLATSSGAT